MTAKWRKGHDPTTISAALTRSKQRDAGFEPFVFDDAIYHLCAAIDISPEIREPLKYPLIRRAALAAGAHATVTPDVIYHAVEEEERRFLSQRRKQYVLFTELSAVPAGATHTRYRDHTVQFSASWRFIDESIKLRRRRLTQAYRKNLPSYRPVKVTTTGRSPEDAGYRALDTLNLLRGIWNLAYNSRIVRRMGWWGERPINPILLSPLQSVHHPSGKLASDEFLRDIEHVGRTRLTDISESWPEIREHEKWVKRKLRHSRERDFLEAMIMRYNRALDSCSPTSVYLQLWALLETLTMTDQAAYDVTIRRVALLFDDYQHHRQALQDLREHRNALIHDALTSAQTGYLVFLLKQYVEATLVFATIFLGAEESRSDMAAFMDSPHEPEVLSKRIKLLRSVLRFRTKPPDDGTPAGG